MGVIHLNCQDCCQIRAAQTVGVSSPIRLAGKLAKPGRTEPSLVAPVGSQLQRLQHIFDVRWFDGARLRRQRRIPEGAGDTEWSTRAAALRTPFLVAFTVINAFNCCCEDPRPNDRGGISPVCGWRGAGRQRLSPMVGTLCAAL